MNLVLAAFMLCCLAEAQPGEPALTIPPAKTSIELDGQSVDITAWGTISRASALALTADLGGLQDRLTSLLAAQLNRSDNCGERLTVEHAAIVPDAPSALLMATLNYERYACAKALGKQITKKLAGGHGAIELNLTPEVADHNISLDAEVRRLDADRSLSEGLRQGISDSIESAIQKSADLKSMLPPGLQNAVTIQSVRFADGGAGRLWLTIAGKIQLSAEQLQGAVGK